MKEMKLGAYVRNDETFEFEFVTKLTASEKITFVNSIVDTVVGDNYNSLVRNLMFDHMIIQLFTNVGNFYMDGDIDTIDAIEQFLNETNIVDIVTANMDDGLYDELSNAVDKAVEYRTGIHPSPIADSIAFLLSTLDKKIKEVDLSNVMDMAQKFAGMTDKFDVDSLVNAYMNSDLHHKNLDEIVNAKNENGIKVIEGGANSKPKAKKKGKTTKSKEEKLEQ